MNIVLLSGGSGKRLWPLSNDIRSKQFIQIFKTKDTTAGDAESYESMVQRVYRQIKTVDADADVSIATSKSQVSAIHNQVGMDVGISVEPCRRDTFPAIALATAYLHDVKGIDENEAVVVCPVDPYVDHSYFMCIKELYEAAVNKDYLWGGSRLNDDFNLGLAANPLAEAWVCSTHPDGPSTLSTGLQLKNVLVEHPEFLGTHPLSITGGKPELPILIKLIDAKKDLSVQVHPDDEYDKAEGQWGKTEMWYVLSAKPSSTLIYGFNRDIEAEQVRRAIENGSIGGLLNHVPVHKDDLFFVEPGTVYAIGAGILLAEIQQSSNLTYRLYDYDRVDKNGKKRELHIDKALDVAKLTSSATPRQPIRVLKYGAGCASELLTRCKYFQVERLLLNTEGRKLAEFQTGKNSFHALLCTDGCGNISGESFNLNFFKGDCVFVPAESIPLKLHGRAQLLDGSC